MLIQMIKKIKSRISRKKKKSAMIQQKLIRKNESDITFIEKKAKMEAINTKKIFTSKICNEKKVNNHKETSAH